MQGIDSVSIIEDPILLLWSGELIRVKRNNVDLPKQGGVKQFLVVEQPISGAGGAASNFRPRVSGANRLDG